MKISQHCQYDNKKSYDAYRIFHNLKLHFNQEKYDFGKYNGKSPSTSIKSFKGKKNKYQYYALSKKDNYPQIALANLLRDSSIWVGDCLTSDASDIYFDWKYRVVNIHRHFEEQLKLLSNHYPDEIRVPKGEIYPPLYNKQINGCISDESMLLLDTVIPMIDRWNTTIKDEFLYPPYSLKLKKYKTFLDYDPKRVKDIFKKRYKIS